jgi:hypothetical protein
MEYSAELLRMKGKGRENAWVWMWVEGGGEGIWPPTNAQVDYASLQVREFFHS